MTMQPTLFGPDAYGGAQARAQDQPTAHQAAAEYEASGAGARHRSIVLAAVERLPGATFRELFAALAAEEQAIVANEVGVMRRLNDLRRAGRVRQGEARACRVTGRQCVTWWPN